MNGTSSPTWLQPEPRCGNSWRCLTLHSGDNSVSGRPRRSEAGQRSVVAVAVDVRQQPGVDGQLNVAVDADSREVLAAGGQTHRGPVAAARRRAVKLAVQVEAELSPVEVEEDADHAAGRDAAVCARRVYAGVHEPAARVVDVHAPAFTVAACTRHVQTHW